MKLFDWLRPRRDAAVAEPDASTSDEARLELRVQTAPRPSQLDADDWAAVDRLRASGREHEALELLRRWIAVQPDDLDATMRLCELLCGRLEHAAARPLLVKLTAAPAHRLRASLLVGEAAERAGELDEARRAYERVLATDLDDPRARAAADRLRPPSPARPAAADELLPERILPTVSARYRLLDELGRGAAGAVYRAEDTEIGRLVALKLLHPHGSAVPSAERAVRAWEEARVAAALRHPGVAAIYDLDEDRRLIVLELCAGGSLRDRLRRGALGPSAALAALRQLCETLDAAHARGIVHGDVKPANLLLRRPLGLDVPLEADELVLCDFGIAHLSGEPGDGAPRGTLAYMAPEQRRGELGAAADVYAAGVVALELILGSAALEELRGGRERLLRGDGDLAERARSALAALGEAAQAAARLIPRLLSEAAASRPSAREVVETLGHAGMV